MKNRSLSEPMAHDQSWANFNQNNSSVRRDVSSRQTVGISRFETGRGGKGEFFVDLHRMMHFRETKVCQARDIINSWIIERRQFSMKFIRDCTVFGRSFNQLAHPRFDWAMKYTFKILRGLLMAVNSKKVILFIFLFFSGEKRTVISQNCLFARIRSGSRESANVETPLSRLIDFRQLRVEQTDSRTPLRDYNPQEGSTKGVCYRLPTFLRLPIHGPIAFDPSQFRRALWIVAKPNSVSYVIPRYPDNRGSPTVERIRDD